MFDTNIVCGPSTSADVVSYRVDGLLSGGVVVGCHCACVTTPNKKSYILKSLLLNYYIEVKTVLHCHWLARFELAFDTNRQLF